MKRVILISIAALQIFAVTGCSTMNGMGDDISNGWHSVFGGDDDHH